LLLLAHYAAVHVAERRAGDRAALQALAQLDASSGASTASPRGGLPVVPLAATGAPARALVWKNVTMLVRRRRLLALGAGWLFALLGLAWLARENPGGAGVLGAFALVWGVLVLLGGPQFLRNDLRSDLDHLALLRTLPVPATSIVGAALLGSIITLGAAVVGLLSVAYVGMRGAGAIPESFRHPAWLAGGVLAVLGVVAVVVLIQNAAALLLPGWTRLTGRTGSAAALGGNLLGMLLTTAGIVVLLYPARDLAQWVLARDGSAAPVLAGGVVLVMATLECVIAVRLLGGVLRRLEPLDELKS
jgi:hypothetical protein